MASYSTNEFKGGLKIMQEKRINSLLVTAPDGQLIGALNMHTLLRAGVA